MKNAILLSALLVTQASGATEPPPSKLLSTTAVGPVMPEAHIHLSRVDLLELEAKQAANPAASTPALVVGQPAPSFTTMAKAAEAGVNPLAPKAPVKSAPKHSADQSTSTWIRYGMIAFAVALLGALYVRIRRARKSLD